MSHAGHCLNIACRVLAHVRAYLDSGQYGVCRPGGSPPKAGFHLEHGVLKKREVKPEGMRVSKLTKACITTGLHTANAVQEEVTRRGLPPGAWRTKEERSQAGRHASEQAHKSMYYGLSALTGSHTFTTGFWKMVLNRKVRILRARNLVFLPIEG